jgi:protein-arginine kinase activator protein McsA
MDPPVTCDLCGKASATQIMTHFQNGKKSIQYRCDACILLESHSPPKLDRPCSKCRQREGEIKFVRLIAKGRVVTYICDVCASK